MGGGDEQPGKKILRGDDLPAEDAIASSGGSWGGSVGEGGFEPAGDRPAEGATRWDPVDFKGADDDVADHGAAHGADDVSGAKTVFPPDRLELGDDDRLPWLESPDDVEDEGVDNGRIVGFVLLALVALIMIVGAVWFASNRAAGPGPADGSTLRAEAGPYKVAPEEPGGKQFPGTGDTSFAVSEGETRGGRIAGNEPAADPAPAPTASATAKPDLTQAPTPPAPKAAPSAPASPAAAGVGVQIGAYKSAADAEQGWVVLSGRNAVLADLKHRVVEGRADIGTVFRLQAVTADLAAANALCARLKAAGQGCQVKR